MVVPPTIFSCPKWKGLSSTARGLCLYLVVRADKTGKAFPSINLIAEDMKHHRKTVIAAVRDIVSQRSKVTD